MSLKTPSVDNSPNVNRSDTVGPSDAMRLNAVKVLEDSDFWYVREMCDNHDGWTLVYEKKHTRVWTKRPDGDGGLILKSAPPTTLSAATSTFDMIKVRTVFDDVSAEVAYDVLQDIDYRKKWDKYMLATIPIGYLNPNNDICYYSLGSLPPFRSRDFVMLRSWLDTGSEKYICGHSVCHDKFPPSKTHIRGLIYLTVYFVRSLGGKQRGCELSYVTHSDPRGKLPSWFVNRLTKIVAPRLVKKLHKACVHYPSWKRDHKPNYKPWLYPDIQVDYPRINLDECRPPQGFTNLDEPLVDESAAPESAMQVNDKNGKILEDDEDEEDE